MIQAKPKVLFIGGTARCGSTLLELLLGQISGFVPIGELRYIWERGLLENHLCGCGQKFSNCPFWAKVMREVFGSRHSLDINALVKLKKSVDNSWKVPRMLAKSIFPAFKNQMAEYQQILTRIYAAISRLTNNSIIIDSSKAPAHGYILCGSPDLDVSVLHLVRDSRAVAYSHQRAKLRPEIHGKKTYMDVIRPVSISRRWNALNILLNQLRFFNRQYHFLRYEDYSRRPQAHLAQIVSRFFPNESNVGNLHAGETRRQPHHTVAGNPIRFQKQSVTIRPDLAWKTEMSKRHKIIVTALTWPLLLKYGYL